MAAAPKEGNLLRFETSPYLLQHAENPVNWVPWKPEHIAQAKAENKLIIVSIGYSSCHWCHVMEKESFEDPEVAKIMNEHFICIKVDREERPDIDQVYMEAVQIMSGQGGWPLNCFTMPDGLPIYGDTYFKKDQWIRILLQLSKLWKEHPEKVKEYGNAVKEGLNRKPILPKDQTSKDWSIEVLNQSLESWKQRVDKVYGGPNRAPKFPMPTNYEFLLFYSFYTKDDDVLAFADLTLKRMARGGIYDQVGGGFTRYSTDIYWKVPHFEKMLYDNAQLIGLYSHASKLLDNPEYAEIVHGTVSWLDREMKDSSGGYYSALDADSEGTEGKFYVWNKFEIPEKYSDFYETGEEGLWEGNLVPVRKFNSQFTKDYHQELDGLNRSLLQIRNERVKPSTDTKIITSWNALLISNLAKASLILDRTEYLEKAAELISFIKTNLYDPDSGTLFHHITAGKRSDQSFFEDYAFYIEALISAYEASGNYKLVEFAKELCLVAIDRFYDEKSGLFQSTNIESKELVTSPVEISDNVIPSSNSVMADNLNTLGNIFANNHYIKISERLLGGMKQGIIEYGEGYGNWMKLWLKKSVGNPEIVITGPDAPKYSRELVKSKFPLSLLAFSTQPNDSDLFRGRFNPDKSLIHICRNHTCQLPQENLEDAKFEIDEIVNEIQANLAG